MCISFSRVAAAFVVLRSSFSSVASPDTLFLCIASSSASQTLRLWRMATTRTREGDTTRKMHTSSSHNKKTIIIKYVYTYLSVICVPSSLVCCKIIIKKHMLICFYDIAASLLPDDCLAFNSSIEILVAFLSCGKDFRVNNAKEAGIISIMNGITVSSVSCHFHCRSEKCSKLFPNPRSVAIKIQFSRESSSTFCCPTVKASSRCVCSVHSATATRNSSESHLFSKLWEAWKISCHIYDATFTDTLDDWTRATSESTTGTFRREFVDRSLLQYSGVPSKLRPSQTLSQRLHKLWFAGPDIDCWGESTAFASFYRRHSSILIIFSLHRNWSLLRPSPSLPSCTLWPATWSSSIDSPENKKLFNSSWTWQQFWT